MKDEMKKLADLFYTRIIGPGSGVNIHWLRKVMRALGVKDENIDQLYIINAPLSREVWYYAFLKLHDSKKLAEFLNILVEKFGAVNLGNLQSALPSLSLEYRDGRFSTRVFKIAVLVSGRGTNLQALIDAVESGKLNARIVVVISNRKNAMALERAKKHGIETRYIPAKKGEKREDYDRRLHEALKDYEPDLIVLAGFLRILTPWFVSQWRIINIHPSLLPAFGGIYGMAVHQAVLEYGCKVSGCTVHFVDEKVDHGPIIVQRCVPVHDDDTPESLAARVLEEEHRALVEAVRLISENKVMVEGRVTKIRRVTD
ncbi:MAG: phosphoribosylglycinamide formyltransferase [Euryarchaeota archaeon]|nr:phosphoribosylglycinamide formyltransferase [Euryarchaeota archaeon]